MLQDVSIKSNKLCDETPDAAVNTELLLFLVTNVIDLSRSLR